LSNYELYDVRICVYQAEYLKRVDYDNDKADPYVRISFNGWESKTSIFRASVHPAWYETIIFEKVKVCKDEKGNFIYNDLITCSIYDHNDYISDRYLGRVSLSLKNLKVVDSSETPVPEESDWKEIVDNNDKRGEGRILVKVLLVKCTDSTPPSILPYTKKATIKVVAVGLRELPSTTLNPFLEMKIQTFPNPLLTHRIQSSEDEASHSVRIHDVEEGRYADRIPDNDETSPVKKNIPLEIVDVQTRITAKSRKPSSSNPNFLSEITIDVHLPVHPVFVRPLVLEVKDSVGMKGKGVSIRTIGRGEVDLKARLPWSKSNKSLALSSSSASSSLPVPLYYSKKEWAYHREFLSGSVEDVIKKSDFDSVDIEHLSFGLSGRSLLVVGKFKGFVRVLESDKRSTAFEDLRPVTKYKVRLYVLEATSLKGFDYDYLNKQPLNSDPYLVVKLGDSVVLNDSKNYVSSATDVDIHKLVEFDCQLPGIARVTIEMRDKDFIGSDLIGTTVIDLEDRFFNESWDSLWDLKPVERRELYNKKSSQPKLTCWGDLMSTDTALTTPPDNIATQPNEAFEVRVVIWGTENVRSMDTIGGVGIGSDLYVTCKLEGCSPQSTDTHWRCQNGNSF
jgi:hypothetical protein